MTRFEKWLYWIMVALVPINIGLGINKGFSLVAEPTAWGMAVFAGSWLAVGILITTLFWKRLHDRAIAGWNRALCGWGELQTMVMENTLTHEPGGPITTDN